MCAPASAPLAAPLPGCRGRGRLHLLSQVGCVMLCDRVKSDLLQLLGESDAHLVLDQVPHPSTLVLGLGLKSPYNVLILIGSKNQCL